MVESFSVVKKYLRLLSSFFFFLINENKIALEESNTRNIKIAS